MKSFTLHKRCYSINIENQIKEVVEMTKQEMIETVNKEVDWIRTVRILQVHKSDACDKAKTNMMNKINDQMSRRLLGPNHTEEEVRDIYIDVASGAFHAYTWSEGDDDHE